MADLSRSEPIFQLGTEQRIEAPSSVASRTAQETDRFSMLLDVLTVVGASVSTCVFMLHYTGAGVWRILALHPDHLLIPVVLIFGYALSIVLNCKRLHLYTPERHISILEEQRNVLQASFTGGLLLAGTLYLLHPRDPRTNIVMAAVALTTVAVSARRLISRILLYRSFTEGTGARNVFIVGSGPTAQALRSHLENMPHLGYAFKGFIEPSGSGIGEGLASLNVVGKLEAVFDHARRHFVDDIFFAAPCDRNEVQRVLQEAHGHDVNIHLVPDLYDSSILNTSVEYLGQFPTIPLWRRGFPQSRLFLKRALDITISVVALVALAPVFLVIAIIIKRDSTGPVFYTSERVGKKGRTFRCLKFRTMVQNAESLRSSLSSKNQRDGILFKLDNDPRITRVGRFLRKYSLDELPQFMNVLRGDMSLVGPRPPLAGEVQQYRPSYLRRLDVMPGITGLWQVQARKDPSFDKYVSLDIAYIENWSIWLDLEIMFRTIGVVFAGTGS